MKCVCGWSSGVWSVKCDWLVNWGWVSLVGVWSAKWGWVSQVCVCGQSSGGVVGQVE